MYYRMLDNDAAGDASRQEWVIRIGTGLAFLSRASLAAVVGISRKQWMWVTLRKKFMTLAGIDAMFGVTSDPIFFTNWNMVKQAKFATLMALLIWIFPLVAIVTPSTISVLPDNRVEEVDCTVRTILFDYEPEPTAKKLCCNNVTYFELADYLADKYQQPSMMVRKIFTISAFSNLTATPSNTGLDYEGADQQLPLPEETNIARDCGSSCTYNVTFLGPAIKCTEKPLSDQTNDPWASQYLNTTLFDAGEWNNTLWVRYVPGTTPNWTDPQALQDLQQHVCTCENSIARYTVGLNIQDGLFKEPIIRDVEILDRSSIDLNNKTYKPNRVLFDVLVDILGGNVAEAKVAKDDSILKRGGYYARGLSAVYQTSNSVNMAFDSISAFNRANSGSIRVTYESGKLVNQTQVGATSLASASYEIVPLIGAAIQKMAQMMVVSLLAADSPGTQKSSPLMEYAALTNTTCISTKPQNVYRYTAWRLVSAYAAAAIVTLSIAIFGFAALGMNGVSSDASFSTILRTTRNPTLDIKTVGGCLGGDPLPKGLQELKLKFGELKMAEGKIVDRHVAMGVEGEDVMLEIDRKIFYS